MGFVTLQYPGIHDIGRATFKQVHANFPPNPIPARTRKWASECNEAEGSDAHLKVVVIVQDAWAQQIPFELYVCANTPTPHDPAGLFLRRRWSNTAPYRRLSNDTQNRD